MDKVLIADSSKAALKKISEDFKELHHFELLTAGDGESALNILRKNKISVFVTSVTLPGLHGIDLIAFMTRKRPGTPCLVLVDQDTPKPWFRNQGRHENFLYYMQKPLEFKSLASAIFVGQNLRDEGAASSGFTLRSFLPLIEISRKTCMLNVVSGRERQGCFYFDRGILLDAESGDLAGEQAAREMVKWGRTRLSFADLPADRTKRVIKSELMDIAGASWGKPGGRDKGRPAESPSRAGAARNRLQSSLDQYADMLGSIKGYEGMAVLSPEGKVLAANTKDGFIDFKKFAPAFNSMLRTCQQSVLQNGFDKCRALSVHTEKWLVLIRTADSLKEGSFRFLVLMKPGGNPYFMQVQLENIIPAILRSRQA